MVKDYKYCYGSCMRPDGTHAWYLIDPDATLKSSYDFYLPSNDLDLLDKLNTNSTSISIRLVLD